MGEGEVCVRGGGAARWEVRRHVGGWARGRAQGVSQQSNRFRWCQGAAAAAGPCHTPCLHTLPLPNQPSRVIIDRGDAFANRGMLLSKQFVVRLSMLLI